MKMKIWPLHISKPMLRVSRLGANVAILQIQKLGLKKRGITC